VARAVGSASGLHPDKASSLLTLAAPMVMGFLSKRVRSQGMSMGDLGNLLQRESSSIRSALPAGMADALWAPAARAAPSPVVAQTVKPEHSAATWLPLLALLLLIPFFFSVFHHTRRPVVVVPHVARVVPTAPALGGANRMANEANRAATPSPVNVFLRFDTASSKLTPQSQAKLDPIANELKANPNAKATISGYTDNVGNANQNLQLSQQRANSVMAELTHKGVAANQLTAQGYGEQNPIANNSSDAGRSMNRRVSVSVAEP
jgi:outer membrane protein OmpA-like peptidoglycan-associated protein